MSNTNIQLLLTGNELMSGDVVDTNSALIAKLLIDKGIKVTRKVTIEDNLSLLAEEITAISKAADILIINGGLGPTTDDLTAEALAKACMQPLEEHPVAKKHLAQWCKKRGVSLSNANLKQATLPQGAEVVDNPIGSAVGFQINLNGCLIICTPGVPRELEAMLNTSILDLIEQKVGNENQYKILRLLTFGLGEAKLQQLLLDKCPDWPTEVTLGYRAASPMLEVKLIIKSMQHQPILDKCYQHLKSLLGDHILTIINKKPPTMAELVLTLLKEKNQTITTAESCTGGLIASLLTRIAGSSQAFEAGYVTYSNDIKHKAIGVRKDTLQQHGAVSEAVVREMALGALNASDANYAIAVSGVAGPSGGSKEKPVGSVWIAWGTAKQLHSHYFLIQGNREYFQNMVAVRALDLIRRELIETDELPFYM